MRNSRLWQVSCGPFQPSRIILYRKRGLLLTRLHRYIVLLDSVNRRAMPVSGAFVPRSSTTQLEPMAWHLDTNEAQPPRSLPPTDEPCVCSVKVGQLLLYLTSKRDRSQPATCAITPRCIPLRSTPGPINEPACIASHRLCSAAPPSPSARLDRWLTIAP